MQLASEWLKPIYREIKEQMMSGPYIQVDETPIKYLDPGNGKAGQGYPWVAHAGSLTYEQLPVLTGLASKKVRAKIPALEEQSPLRAFAKPEYFIFILFSPGVSLFFVVVPDTEEQEHPAKKLSYGEILSHAPREALDPGMTPKNIRVRYVSVPEINADIRRHAIQKLKKSSGRKGGKTKAKLRSRRRDAVIGDLIDPALLLERWRFPCRLAGEKATCASRIWVFVKTWDVSWISPCL